MASNLTTIQTLYAAFGRGDVPAILELLHPEVVWEYQPISLDVPWLQSRRGRAGAAEFFQTLGELDFTRFTVNAIVEGPQLVIAMVDLEATVKRTGRSITERDEVHLWHFDVEGRVVRFRHCVDTHQHHRAWVTA